MISKSDIIFARVQYQHDIIFALLLFCSETSDKNNYVKSNEFLEVKIRFSNFQNNKFDIMIERDVIFTRRHVQMMSSNVTPFNGCILRR